MTKSTLKKNNEIETEGTPIRPKQKEIKTEGPISEKDEIKNAEDQMRAQAKGK